MQDIASDRWTTLYIKRYHRKARKRPMPPPANLLASLHLTTPMTVEPKCCQLRDQRSVKSLVCHFCFLVNLPAILLLTCQLITTTISGDNTLCYPDIGCFPMSAEFYDPINRPINARPWHRRRIKTTFTLFNRHNDMEHGFKLEPWNLENLKQAKFDTQLETKVIVPGWLDNMKRTVWVRKMKDSFLWLWTPVNVIVVQWVNFTPYTMATANTRIVGAELANLVHFLEASASYSRAYYHIIGHSLGAHIAGYCGQRVKALGRITALDPARPFFQGMPKSVRLDRSDAKFVDAIHSDFTPENAIFLLMSFGMTRPVGHVDFYPNGPPILQPGCLRDSLMSVQNGVKLGAQHSSLSVAFLESIRYLTACDHQRSHEWFIESVTNRNCIFTGVQCPDFDGLLDARCTCDDNPRRSCAVMGIHADQMFMNNAHEESRSSLNIDDRYGTQATNYIRHKVPNIGAAYSRQLASAALLEHLLLQQEPAKLSASNKLVLVERTRKRRKRSALLRPNPNPNSSDSNNETAPSDDFYNNDDDDDDVDYGKYQSTNDTDLSTAESQSNSQESRLQRKYDDQVTDDSGLIETLMKLRSSLGSNNFDASIAKNSAEALYETQSRWYLKTNSRQPYCVNQYQVLIFFGQATSFDTNQLRAELSANLVLSIIGTKGRLINQRFVPQSSLASYTMQPFFVILEGTYQLGDIQSVAVAWQGRGGVESALKSTQLTYQGHPLLPSDKTIPQPSDANAAYRHHFELAGGLQFVPPMAELDPRHAHFHINRPRGGGPFVLNERNDFLSLESDGDGDDDDDKAGDVLSSASGESTPSWSFEDPPIGGTAVDAAVATLNSNSNSKTGPNQAAASNVENKKATSKVKVKATVRDTSNLTKLKSQSERQHEPEVTLDSHEAEIAGAKRQKRQAAVPSDEAPLPSKRQFDAAALSGANELTADDGRSLDNDAERYEIIGQQTLDANDDGDGDGGGDDIDLDPFVELSRLSDEAALKRPLTNTQQQSARERQKGEALVRAAKQTNSSQPSRRAEGRGRAKNNEWRPVTMTMTMTTTTSRPPIVRQRPVASASLSVPAVLGHHSRQRRLRSQPSGHGHAHLLDTNGLNLGGPVELSENLLNSSENESESDESVQIVQVRVSAVQATYGRLESATRTFCPPSANFKLVQNQSAKFVQTLAGVCQ